MIIVKVNKVFLSTWKWTSSNDTQLQAKSWFWTFKVELSIKYYRIGTVLSSYCHPSAAKVWEYFSSPWKCSTELTLKEEGSLQSPFWTACVRTSSFNTLPSWPVPRMWFISTPYCFARFLTAGVARTPPVLLCLKSELWILESHTSAPIDFMSSGALLVRFEPWDSSTTIFRRLSPTCNFIEQKASKYHFRMSNHCPEKPISADLLSFQNLDIGVIPYYSIMDCILKTFFVIRKK